MPRKQHLHLDLHLNLAVDLCLPLDSTAEQVALVRPKIVREIKERLAFSSLYIHERRANGLTHLKQTGPMKVRLEEIHE